MDGEARAWVRLSKECCRESEFEAVEKLEREIESEVGERESERDRERESRSERTLLTEQSL